MDPVSFAPYCLLVLPSSRSREKQSWRRGFQLQDVELSQADNMWTTARSGADAVPLEMSVNSREPLLHKRALKSLGTFADAGKETQHVQGPWHFIAGSHKRGKELKRSVSRVGYSVLFKCLHNR